jgi:hypothetical protein
MNVGVVQAHGELLANFFRLALQARRLLWVFYRVKERCSSAPVSQNRTVDAAPTRFCVQQRSELRAIGGVRRRVVGKDGRAVEDNGVVLLRLETVLPQYSSVRRFAI